MQEFIQRSEAELRKTASQFGQEHLFSWWQQISDLERKHLLQQIGAIEFPLIRKLTETLLKQSEIKEQVELAPAPIIKIPEETAEKEKARVAREVGEVKKALDDSEK